MKKKIAIFCDGTWQSLRSATATNVVRLSRCVSSADGAGVPQIVYYDEGVGVGSEVGRVPDLATRVWGGALGRGLDRKIERAYQFLVLNFDPGDDIFIFGFSRGAYTARSLCGLIRKCGIVKRDCFYRIPEAIDHYRGPLHPASPEMVQFRQSYTHRLAAGPEDYDRLEIVAPEADERSIETRADLFQYRPDRTYRMMFAGIWDTVGALGIPRRFDLLRLGRKSYQFHDTSASSLLASIRHAVAANERRVDFDVTPYDNLDELNIQWAAKTGWNVVAEADPRFVPYNCRPYQERWFPGDHSDAGGGNLDCALASSPLLWMAEGAGWAGLAFDRNASWPLGEADRLRNPLKPLGPKATQSWPGGPLRRRGPPTVPQIAFETRLRYVRDKSYRPPNLTGLGLRGGREGRPPPGFPPA